MGPEQGLDKLRAKIIRWVAGDKAWLVNVSVTVRRQGVAIRPLGEKDKGVFNTTPKASFNIDKIHIVIPKNHQAYAVYLRGKQRPVAARNLLTEKETK